MRYRSALALAIVLPSLLSAQGRRPRIGGGVTRPEPGASGATPEVIQRAQAIVRSRVSFETYPMFSHVSAPGFSGGRPVTSWNNFGTGTHVDFRHTEWFSSTLDLTASYLGGPATSESIEGGFRIRPSTWTGRMRPFADVRLGWQNSSDQYMSSPSSDLGIGPASVIANNIRYSRGFGGAAGIGSEIAITNSYSVITGLSAMRSHMNTYDYRISSVQTTGNDYYMTTYRLILGLRYNRARTVNLRQPAASASLH